MIDRSSLTTPESVRQAARRGELIEQTSGLAAGFAQANLVILPQELAFDFLLFCRRNHKPCPLLEVTEVAIVDEIASAADLVMGKASGVPVAIVRGLDWSNGHGRATDLVRAPDEDLFR